MKINIEIDCSPAEARAFFGLPDIAALQEQMVRQAGERLSAAMANMDPETLMKTWLPTGLQGMEQLQKMFWHFAGQEGRKGGQS